MLIFALGSTAALGAAIAGRLGTVLAGHEERDFEDGEHKARPLTSVRDRDVYLVQGLHGDADQSPNDKILKLLFLAGAVRDAGARRVTAVTPYLAYARKDRRTQTRDPITSRYVAQLFEAAGIDRIVAVDVHNLAAFENAFRRPAINLEARPLFVAHLLPLLRGRDVAVVSPDAGGVKRAELIRATLADRLDIAVPLAFLAKRRSGGVVSGQDAVVGDVGGRVAVVVDDLVSTGTTLARAVAACRAAGASAAIAVATHGLFTGDAARVVMDGSLDRLIVTNTVPPFRLSPTTVAARLTVLDVAPLLAEAIRRLHEGGSVADLAEVDGAQCSPST